MRATLLLSALLMSGTMLAGCASEPDVAKLTGGKTAAEQSQADADAASKIVPTDLEGSVRQAQLLRTGGHYDEAIHVLSQVMLVAADDPRVVGEYGKTLAQMGRAQDAVQFLSRAVELSPNDWTLYSAQGVAYDQLGNQAAASTAYNHALALKPGEPGVLNNFALSRMLANDPDGARNLIERARIAGGASDPKIARNIALVNELAPAPQAPEGLAYAVNTPAPSAPPAPEARMANAPVASAPVAHMAANALAPVANAPANRPQPFVALPRPQQQMAQQQQRAPMQPAANVVVMQRVPEDPLAGPVAPAVAVHAPRPLMPAHVAAKTEAPKPETAKAEPVKAEPVKAADAKPVAAAPKAVDAAKPAAKAPDAKPATPVKAAAAPAPVKAAAAAPAKPAAKDDAKPVTGPVAKVAMTPPVKTAAADKPADKLAQIPTLRMAAGGY